MPRILSVSTVTENLSASVLRLKLRARSLPDGSRYRTCQLPPSVRLMCAITFSFLSVRVEVLIGLR